MGFHFADLRLFGCCATVLFSWSGWFERLVKRLSRLTREFTMSESVLLLHIRSLIESSEGFYVHPSTDQANLPVGGLDTCESAATRAFVQRLHLLHADGGGSRSENAAGMAAVGAGNARAANGAAAPSLAAATAVQDARMQTLLQRSMCRVLASFAENQACLKEREVVEMLTFMRHDVLCLDDDTFVVCLKRVGVYSPDLNYLYCASDRGLGSRGTHHRRSSTTSTPRNGGTTPNKSPQQTPVLPPHAEEKSPRAPGLSGFSLENVVQAAVETFPASVHISAPPVAIPTPPIPPPLPLPTDLAALVASEMFAYRYEVGARSARALADDRVSSHRVKRLTNMDKFVGDYAPGPTALPSSRVSKALPLDMQHKLGLSLSAYVSAVRQQRQNMDVGDPLPLVTPR
jgi:hypothetical protein